MKKRHHAIIQKFDETIGGFTGKIKDEINECIKKVTHCKGYMDNIEEDIKFALKKQSQKTNSVSGILTKSLSSMNASIEKGMAEKEMLLMNHFDKRISLLEAKLHEIDQKSEGIRATINYLKNNTNKNTPPPLQIIDYPICSCSDLQQDIQQLRSVIHDSKAELYNIILEKTIDIPELKVIITDNHKECIKNQERSKGHIDDIKDRLEVVTKSISDIHFKYSLKTDTTKSLAEISNKLNMYNIQLEDLKSSLVYTVKSHIQHELTEFKEKDLK